MGGCLQSLSLGPRISVPSQLLILAILTTGEERTQGLLKVYSGLLRVGIAWWLYVWTQWPLVHVLLPVLSPGDPLSYVTKPFHTGLRLARELLLAPWSLITVTS